MLALSVLVPSIRKVETASLYWKVGFFK